MTDAHEFVEDALNATSPPSESGQTVNVVTGALSDEELVCGGMVPIKSYMRTKRSREALRKQKQRTNLALAGERELSVKAPDNEPDREALRAAATSMLQEKDNVDKTIGPAIDVILSNPQIRSLVLEITKRPEICEAVMVAWRNPRFVRLGQALSANLGVLESIRIVLEQPNIIVLGKAVAACSGLRQAIVRRLLTGRPAR